MASMKEPKKGGYSDAPVVGTRDMPGSSMSAGVIFELVLTQESLRARRLSAAVTCDGGPRPYQFGAVQWNGRKPKCCWTCSMVCPDWLNMLWGQNTQMNLSVKGSFKQSALINFRGIG